MTGILVKPKRDLESLIGNPSRLVLPGDYKKPLSRKEIISKFLDGGGWIAEKQNPGMRQWVEKMLDEFGIELLLYASNIGVNQLLGESRSLAKTNRTLVVNLPVVPPKQEPHRQRVNVDELQGELNNGAKTLKLKDVKDPDPAYYEGCD